MSRNQNTGCSVCAPGIVPSRPIPGPSRPMPGQSCPMTPPSRPMPASSDSQFGPGPVMINPSDNQGNNMRFNPDSGRFPVGMGYVPWQGWENTYPIEQGFRRGTIFPSLDYPFVMGRCRR